MFTQASHVRIHISSVHEKNKPFECEICQMSFAEKGKLTRHIASVHEKKRLFKFDSCPKTFCLAQKLLDQPKIVLDISTYRWIGQKSTICKGVITPVYVG